MPRSRSARPASVYYNDNEEYAEDAARPLPFVYNNNVKRQRVVYLEAEDVYSSDSSDEDFPETFFRGVASGTASGSNTPRLLMENPMNTVENSNAHEIRMQELQNEKVGCCKVDVV